MSIYDGRVKAKLNYLFVLKAYNIPEERFNEYLQEIEGGFPGLEKSLSTSDIVTCHKFEKSEQITENFEINNLIKLYYEEENTDETIDDDIIEDHNVNVNTGSNRIIDIIKIALRPATILKWVKNMLIEIVAVTVITCLLYEILS